jgi:hypothetical protein
MKLIGMRSLVGMSGYLALSGDVHARLDALNVSEQGVIEELERVED